MLDLASDSNIIVYENYSLLSSTNLKALYCDGNVALSKDLDTSAERKCILAEEIGHHKTTVGNIIDLKDYNNFKQEHRARSWAYANTIQLTDLIDAYENGVRNRYELSEFLNVTESFLEDAIKSFQERYGPYTRVGRHIIYFSPLIIESL